MKNPPIFSNLTIFAGITAVYLLLAQLTIILNNPVALGASFWPAAGVTTGAMLLLPRRQWIWVLLGIFVAEIGTDTSQGYPITASLLWALGNCIEPLLAATLLRRSGNDFNSLTPIGNLLRFIICAVIVAPLAGGTIGSMGTIFIMEVPAWQSWPKYVVGDALGVLVFAPVILTWHATNAFPRHRFEGVALALCVLTMCSFTFRSWGYSFDIVLAILLLPLMLWAALRFGVKGTAWVIFLIANVANIATALGFGPFDAIADPTGHALTVLQILLVISSATALIVAVLTHDLVQGRRTEIRLIEQAHHDALTGLYNRLGMEVQLENMRRRFDMGAAIVSVLACDLDKFKSTNDSFGHLAGDEVLKEVASRLRSSIRDADFAVRLGGDEFVVLVFNRAPATVQAIAERILEVVARPIQQMHLTISIGISSGALHSDFQALLAAADNALYEAKYSGRNRWVNAAALQRQPDVA